MKSTLRVAMTVEQSWHRVPGGTAVAALGMARGLSSLPSLDVVGVAAWHRHPPRDPWAPPIPVRQLRLPRPALYEAWHRLRRPRVQAATGPVDVIHATSMAIPPRSAPLVVTIHDLAFVDQPASFTPRGMRFFRAGLRLALLDADLVTCPSRASVSACLAAGFPAEKVRHVPLGAEGAKVSEDEIDRVRSRYRLRDPYIFWSGTIEPRKNLKGLLEAFGMLDRAHTLVLAGPDGWNEDIDPLVEGSRGRVRRVGFVPPSDLGALYAGAAVFCFPSLLEGFGFPVLEAMAQGTPVVTSLGTSTEELAGDAAVLVDPRDATSIAAGLESVLGNEELARSLRAAGPARAAQFSWQRTAALLEEVYREVAA